MGGSAPLSLETWNETQHWKFAWPAQRVEPFLCFGGNAWGDQYAYLHGEGEAVFMLDAYAMEVEKIAGSFEDFFWEEFQRCARDPYDSLTTVALDRCGSLGWSQQVAQAPPVLLAGELPDAAVRLPARTVMIFNGDVNSQLESAAEGAVVAEIRPYQDKFGRDRLEVVWST